MGYKVLGFVVWQGGKWYLRRRVSDSKVPTAAAAVAGVALLAGAAVAAKQATSHQ
jgi:hypothetical protein